MYLDELNHSPSRYSHEKAHVLDNLKSMGYHDVWDEELFEYALNIFSNYH